MIPSEETRMKISKANKGQQGKTGKDNPMYGLLGENNPNFGSKRNRRTKEKYVHCTNGKR